MAPEPSLQDTVDRNYEAFRKVLPRLLKEHPGEYALLREGQAVGYFETPGEALADGDRRYPDRLFSVQQVTDRIIDLGIFSHAKTDGPV